MTSEELKEKRKAFIKRQGRLVMTLNALWITRVWIIETPKELSKYKIEWQQLNPWNPLSYPAYIIIVMGAVTYMFLRGIREIVSGIYAETIQLFKRSRY